MTMGVFPGAFQPGSHDVLAALAAVAVDVGGIKPLEAGHTGALMV